ncbi:MAG TPA: hypothetical protein VJJ24_00580 [Candidatus Paceibacterota bacterium]
MKALIWQQSDQVIDSIMRHRLAPEGCRLVQDGAFAERATETLAHALARSQKNRQLDRQGDGYLDCFASDLRGVLDSGTREPSDLIAELAIALAATPGHHMTPGTRINTIGYFLADRARFEGISTTNVNFDGTAPAGGEIARLIGWWVELGPTHREIYGPLHSQLDRLLGGCGFESMKDVLTLGHQLQSAGIKPGDPHTL